MKSLVATTSFALALFTATAALANHSVKSNSWPIPGSQSSFVTQEEVDFREFKNVQRGTFPEAALDKTTRGGMHLEDHRRN